MDFFDLRSFDSSAIIRTSLITDHFLSKLLPQPSVQQVIGQLLELPDIGHTWSHPQRLGGDLWTEAFNVHVQRTQCVFASRFQLVSLSDLI